MEFSKKILLTAGLVNLFVVGFSCYLMWKSQNAEPLAFLIPSVAAETATGTGFYYQKAKAENEIKLKMKLGDRGKEEAYDQQGIL